MSDEESISIQPKKRPSTLRPSRLARVQTRIRHAVSTVLAQQRLTPAQFDVMRHLTADPGLRQQTLAERLLVTKENIHHNAMLDFLFTKKVHQQLIAENKAQRHHVLPDPGWVRFLVCEGYDIDQAALLSRRSYLAQRLTRARTVEE